MAVKSLDYCSVLSYPCFALPISAFHISVLPLYCQRRRRQQRSIHGRDAIQPQPHVQTRAVPLIPSTSINQPSAVPLLPFPSLPGILSSFGAGHSGNGNEISNTPSSYPPQHFTCRFHVRLIIPKGLDSETCYSATLYLSMATWLPRVACYSLPHQTIRVFDK